MNEIITVVIPTYKRPDRILRAVESALNQTAELVEVIVVDDNGKNTENQLQTQKALKDLIDANKIIYLVNDQNSGGSFTRNEGLKIAKGKYITFLDDDDEISPNKLEVQANRLEELGDEYSCCFCGYHKILGNGKEYTNGEHCEGDVYLYALARSIYNGSGSNLLVNTKIARMIGGYDIEFKRNQDLEFMARLLKDYKLAFVKDDLFTIHYEIREKVYSYDERIVIDEFYLQKFKKEIENLSKHDQAVVYKTFALERWRFSLNAKKEKDAKKYLKENHVTAFEFIRYFFYLVDRVIRKKSYGFKL